VRRRFAGRCGIDARKTKIVHSLVVRPSLTRVAAAVVLLWSLFSVAAVLRNAVLRQPYQVTSLEAEFRALARELPPTAVIGFLEYSVDDASPDHVMVYYVAQYALAPRVVLKRTDVDFLLVARDALRRGHDERISGFELVASSRQGNRLYRRSAN
jgi:hypothetical protein